MNPYSRFRLVSNTLSAALIVCALAVFGQAVFASIAGVAGTGPSLWMAMGASVAVLVVFWLAMTEAIFPSLFRFNIVRRVVLGKYYIEGTWLQAERGAPDGPRLAVIDIQPAGRSFIFSGYALNQNLEIESNTLIEFSKFEWPFMSYKYRNSLSDGADGQRDGVGEIQFEMNRTSAARYNGYAQFVKNTRRLKIEGAKLKKNAEVKRLRSLEHRKQILEKYWNLFFNVSIAQETVPSVLDRAAVIKSEAPRIERRTETAVAVAAADAVVPRRRASDWRQEDATPTVARIRSKVAEDVIAEAEEELIEDTVADIPFDAEDTYHGDDEDSFEYDAEEDDHFDAEVDDVEEDTAIEDEDTDSVSVVAGETSTRRRRRRSA